MFCKHFLYRLRPFVAHFWNKPWPWVAMGKDFLASSLKILENMLSTDGRYVPLFSYKHCFHCLWFQKSTYFVTDLPLGFTNMKLINWTRDVIDLNLLGCRRFPCHLEYSATPHLAVKTWYLPIDIKFLLQSDVEIAPLYRRFYFIDQTFDLFSLLMYLSNAVSCSQSDDTSEATHMKRFLIVVPTSMLHL